MLALGPRRTAENPISGSDIPYRLKESPYSSHMQMLDTFPLEGAGRKVLDVGCSDGYFASLLADRRFKVTGLEHGLGYSAGFPSNVRLIECDLEAGLPDLQEKYSYIVCADVLEHLRHPLSILSALRALLERDGRLVASLPNSGNIYFRLNVLFGRFPKEERGLFDRTHLHFFTWDGWVQLLTEAGFQVETVRPTSIPFTTAFPDERLRSTLQALEAFWFVLARIRKTLFAYQFVITAVKKRTMQ